VVICLERGADLHTAQLIHCHSLSLVSFWYWLTQVVPDKGPLNGCVRMCMQRLTRHVSVIRMTNRKIVGDYTLLLPTF